MWKVRVQISQFLCDGFATLQVHKFNLHTKIIRYLYNTTKFGSTDASVSSEAHYCHCPARPRPNASLLSTSPQLRLFPSTNVVAHSARLHCCVEGSIPNFLFCGANDMPYRAIFGATTMPCQRAFFPFIGKNLPLDFGNNERIAQSSFTNHFPQIGLIMVLSPHDWQAGDHGNALSPGK